MRAVLILAFDYGLHCLLLLLLGAPLVFFGLYTFLLACNVALPALLLVKWYRYTATL